jgi:phage shock protein C
MHRVIDISLTGHTAPFRLHDDAYERLRQYMDRARARLADDPDQPEVVGDLERSIGDKLSSRLGPSKLVIDDADVSAVLDQIGTVEPGDARPAAPAAATVEPAPGGRRRLYRIREGQQLAGICTGLAAYAELDVTLVRWVFVLLGLITAGVFFLVYVIAMFIIPVLPTREAFTAAQTSRNDGS